MTDVRIELFEAKDVHRLVNEYYESYGDGDADEYTVSEDHLFALDRVQELTNRIGQLYMKAWEREWAL